MDVKVEDGLSSPGSHVDYGAIAVFNVALARDLRRSQMTAAHGLSIFSAGLFQSANVLLGDDQHVRRSLWVDVFEGKGVIVFENFPGRNFSANDAAEQAIFHVDLRASQTPESRCRYPSAISG